MASLAAAAADCKEYLILVENAKDLREDSLITSSQYLCIVCNNTIGSEMTPLSTKATWNSGFLMRIPNAILNSTTTTVKIEVFNSSKVFVGQAFFDIDKLACSNVGQWNRAQEYLGGETLGGPEATGIISISARVFCKTSVKILSADNLRNDDGPFDASDPYCNLTGLNSTKQLWGSTETIRNCLSPVWSTPQQHDVDATLHIPTFSYLHPFVLTFYDEDNKKRTDKDHPLGNVTIPVDVLFTSIDNPTRQETYDLGGEGLRMGGSKVTFEVKLI